MDGKAMMTDLQIKTASISASGNISISAKLRALAVAIENGSYGTVSGLAMIIEGNRIEAVVMAPDGEPTPILGEGELMRIAMRLVERRR